MGTADKDTHVGQGAVDSVYCHPHVLPTLVAFPIGTPLFGIFAPAPVVKEDSAMDMELDGTEEESLFEEVRGQI